jgi:hypothetical protein
MKRSTTGGKKTASEEVPVQELVPQLHPSAECYRHKMILNVFGKRYELTRYTEVRVLTNGPAKVIEMPIRPPTEI